MGNIACTDSLTLEAKLAGRRSGVRGGVGTPMYSLLFHVATIGR
jgi:hypothetical protein